MNRNYGFEWGLNSGSSPNTYDDTYRGPSAFSEPEVAVFRDFIAARHNPKALLTYHTFTEQFLRPWSYTTSDPPGKSTLEHIVQDSIARIDVVHGESYGGRPNHTEPLASPFDLCPGSIERAESWRQRVSERPEVSSWERTIEGTRKPELVETE